MTLYLLVAAAIIVAWLLLLREVRRPERDVRPQKLRDLRVVITVNTIPFTKAMAEMATAMRHADEAAREFERAVPEGERGRQGLRA